MSYLSVDTSQQDARPVLLFMFMQGAQTWYYWPGPVPFLHDGHSYLPAATLPGEIENTGDVPKDALTIELPIDNPFTAQCLAYTADAVTTLTVFRKHADGDDAEIEWKGRVLGQSASVATLKLTCESIFASMRRLGIRQTYQRLCRFALGDDDCGVDREAYSATLTVLAVVGSKVTFSATLAVDYKRGMLLAPDGSSRMIVDTGSNFIVLMRPMQSLADSLVAQPTGFTVKLYQGCDRSTTMCAERFNNIGNSGAFPGIKWVNPMTNVSSVF